MDIREIALNWKFFFGFAYTWVVLWLNNNCLLQEQLRYKSKFNFVTFDGQAIAWREKLAEINEDNLKQAVSWIRDIKVKCILWWDSAREV